MAKKRSTHDVKCGEIGVHPSHWWGMFDNLWCDGEGLGG
jgi:hypothetical protein